MIKPRFANPYLRCLRCNKQVVDVRRMRNEPCGHYGGYRNACMSWSPVDGCTCTGVMGRMEH